jgi:hypothetical protein
VRGDARAETRIHFRTGFTRVVPWLVVSRHRSLPRCRPPLADGSFGH